MNTVCEENVGFSDVASGGRKSSVAISIRYGLDGPGIESWSERNFSQPSRPAFCTMGAGSLCWV